MTDETVTAQWVESTVFLLKDHNGFPVVMTQPNGVKGSDLLPLSLAGCAGWDVMGILIKQRQAVERFEVAATSERDPDPPWTFRKIHLLYRVEGRGISEAAVRRAVELAHDKYCSIYATLKSVVAIDHEVVITEAASSH
jgi:putative redox protein